MNYCESFCRTIQRLCNSGGGGLPAEYQQVEYLESSSANGQPTSIHIETGVTYFADFEIVCMRTNNDGTKFCGVQRNTCLQRSGTDGKFAFYNTSSNYYNSSYSMLTKTKIAWRNDKIYIDDVYIRDYAKATSTTGDFNLFGAGGSEPYYYTNVRIYSFKAWNTNGGLIREMYPCYRKTDNVKGFYDIVTNTYMTGIGNGSFIAGDNV